MVYCSKCGRKNEDDARFCSGCAAPLAAAPRDFGKEAEDKCERECAGGPRRASVIWGLIVILIGLWIVFELGLKRISGLPTWLTDFQFWWIFPLLIGLVIIVVGIGMIAKRF